MRLYFVMAAFTALPLAARADFIVANYDGSSVFRVTSEGVVSTLIPSVSYPTGIGLDASGNVYVAAQGYAQVLKYDASGTLLGSANGFGYDLQDVAVGPDGAVYAADGETIKKITSFTMEGTTAETFVTIPGLAASGLAVGPDGFLYAAGAGSNDIFKINLTTGGTSTFATFAQNFTKTGLAFGPDNYLYVNSIAGGINKISPQGSISFFANSAGATGIAVLPNGHVFSAVAGAGSIYEYQPNGTYDPTEPFATGLGNPFYMESTVAVPEPSTYAMALAGLACGGYLVRRRRKQA